MGNSIDARTLVLELVRKERGRPIPAGIVLRKLLETPAGREAGRRAIYDVVDALVAEGALRLIVQRDGHKTALVMGYENAAPLLDQAAEGKISIHTNGSGFIRLDHEDRSSHFVHAMNLHGALNGDRVKFAPLDKKKERDLQDATVLEVISRAKTHYVGRVAYENNKTLLIPHDVRLYLKIFVDHETNTADLREGDLVLFTITSYGQNKDATAHIVHKICAASAPDVATLATIYDMGIELEYPADALAEAAKLTADFSAEATQGRRDLTDRNLITIDPATSKDLDDAICVERLEDGNWRLIVAIADVAYYVRPGTALDAAARERSTSIYLPDRVIPMLPEKLANDLCSLNPSEKKMVLVSETIIGPDGLIVADKDKGGLRNNVYPAIIQSKRRFAYDEVNAYWKNPDTLKDDQPAIKAMLDEVRLLASALRKMKQERGYNEFTVPEATIELDDQLRPVAISAKTHGEAEAAIEDMMVCANEAVARIASHKKLPFVYRVHPVPQKRKLELFVKEAKTLDFKLNSDPLKAMSFTTIRDWLRDNADNKNLPIVHILLLRVMGKAFYSTKNLRHFGLASRCYTHFTSPIRRYADLLVHRLLWQTIFTEDQAAAEITQKGLESALQLVNDHEIRAVDCERAVNSHYFCVFMAQRVGHLYDGFVSSVTNFGMFVELPNTIDGLVRLGKMHGDYYQYSEAAAALIGRDTGKKWTVGVPARIKVSHVDVPLKQIDFELLPDSSR